MRFRSLRWQLSLTYAGIALLTALVLNLLLLGALQAYYEDQEQAYLLNNAAFITHNLVGLIEAGVPEEALAAQLKALSFLSQIRLRLIDTDQGLIADSGSPALVQLEIVVSPQTASPQPFPPANQAGADEENASRYGAYLTFPPPPPRQTHPRPPLPSHRRRRTPRRRLYPPPSPAPPSSTMVRANG